MGVIEREAYLASAALAAEKGAFPLFDRDRYLEGETVAGTRLRCARGDRPPRHPQCAPDLGGADRDDFAVRRQRLLGDRAGVQLSPHPQRADARRRPARGGGRGLRPPRVPPRPRRGGTLARLFCRRPGADTRGPSGHAGGRAKARRQLDLKDDQCPGRHPVRALQGCLPAGLCAGLQGLHDLPPERGNGCGAGGPARAVMPVPSARPAPRRPELPLPPPAPAVVAKTRRHLRGGWRGLHDPAVEPARGLARPDLQAALAGERARALHHLERHRPGRPPAARSRSLSTRRTWSTTPGPWP